MARRARAGLSTGISIKVTSGLAVRTRRVTGSEAATGKLAQVWTVRATLVPSTSTCRTARCSLSGATITTDNSGITTCCWLVHSETLSHPCPLPTCCLALLVELARIQERLRIVGPRRLLRVGRYAVHRAQDHKFRIALFQALAAKEIPQDRDVAKPRDFVIDVGHPVVHKPSDYKALTVLQLKFSFGFARAKRWHRESGDGQRVGKIQGAHFRSHLQVNIPVRHDHGSELQAHAKFLERDRNRRKACAWLHDGKWKLTSGEKAGFLAIDRNQIGLGENLQQILGGKSFDRGSEVNVRSKQKQVQNVIHGCAGTGGSGGAGRRCGRPRRQGLRTEAAELPG